MGKRERTRETHARALTAMLPTPPRTHHARPRPGEREEGGRDDELARPRPRWRRKTHDRRQGRFSLISFLLYTENQQSNHENEEKRRRLS